MTTSAAARAVSGYVHSATIFGSPADELAVMVEQDLSAVIAKWAYRPLTGEEQAWREVEVARPVVGRDRDRRSGRHLASLLDLAPDPHGERLRRAQRLGELTNVGELTRRRG